jgi:hypothetical protein
MNSLSRAIRQSSLWIVTLLLLTACQPAWNVTLTAPGEASIVVQRESLEELERFEQAVDSEMGVPLEQVLYEYGFEVIRGITVIDRVGNSFPFEWASIADEAWWFENGELLITGDRYQASGIEIMPSSLLSQAEARITDIAPTVATALHLRLPKQAIGRPLVTASAGHVLLILLDGFGYLRYIEASEKGLLTALSQFDTPLLAITTYPPITTVSTASFLTGAPPVIHGADQPGIRKTEAETIFDVAIERGLEVVAVEGEALAFTLRSAETTLSGDRDGNGSTDDNVLANAEEVLAAGMPDLFFVHFHGIDDSGHSYGPGSPQEEASIIEVDAAVGQLIELVPEGTLIVIFADHGMHSVDEEGRLGNHGHLIERDMFIPIFLIQK